MDKNMTPKLYLIRGLIIGIFVGQLFMIPHVLKWINYPIEHVIFAPLSTYENINEYDYTIKNVITKERKKPVDLLIKIMPIVKIRLAYQKINPEYDVSKLVGFYEFDEENNRHVVRSPDQASILAHEIRHAFEGIFHRSKDDVLWCPHN